MNRVKQQERNVRGAILDGVVWKGLPAEESLEVSLKDGFRISVKTS